MPAWLILWLLAVNVVTAAAYAWDKARSRVSGARRIRERTLWVLCLAGGVVGAWIVFFALRHKTRHRSFWLVQVVASVVWGVVVLVVLFG